MKKIITLLLLIPSNLWSGQTSSTYPVPRALYHFNEGSGTSSKDSTQNNLNATLTGAIWGTGMNGAAMLFTGTTGKYATIPSSIFNIPLKFTSSAWFNTNAVEANKSIVRFGYKCVILIGFDDGVPGRIRGGIMTNSPDAWNFVYTGYPTPKKWTHAVFTGQEGGGLYLYIDGVQVASGTWVAGSGMKNNVLQANRVGNDSNSSTCCNFNGSIDEVAIYDFQISKGQVQRLYQEGLGRHANAR